MRVNFIVLSQHQSHRLLCVSSREAFLVYLAGAPLGCIGPTSDRNLGSA